MVQKYRLNQKTVQMKVVDNSISYKSSVNAHVYLPLPIGARRLKRLPRLRYYNALRGEVHSLKGLTLPKLPIKSKNASNKSCP